ncbi:MAG: DNA translocase FtsK [Chlamydiales bacterium]|nr:DNA translocase FtsK [Chlamydiales bacterium]
MRKTAKKSEKKPVHPDAQGLFFLFISFLGLISLSTFSYLDPQSNWLGYVGYLIAWASEYVFGLSAYLFPLYFFGVGLKWLLGRKSTHPAYDQLYFSILLLSASFLLTAFAESFPQQAAYFQNRVVTEMIVVYTPYPQTIIRCNLGGIPFYFLYADLPALNLMNMLSPIGTALIFSCLALASCLLLTRIRIVLKLKQIFFIFQSCIHWLSKRLEKKPSSKISTPDRIYTGLSPNSSEPKNLKINLPLPEKPALKAQKPLEIKTEVKKEAIKKESAVSTLIKLNPPKEKELDIVPTKALILRKDASYKIPSPNLLTSPAQKIDQPTLKKDLMHQAAVLEETLKSFGIEAKVGEINSGPTITSFEVHPSIGVKVQKIKTLENDIALNMQAKSIRIVAPIPGKAAVGVEIPAIHPQEVSFKELLMQYQQKGRRLSIPVLLGKAVNGECVFSDLAKMPHCLIAGATGSGKSVCVNTIVMSILMNARPDEVKLLMIDPKKVELTQYSRLPHMIAPVITEAHGAYSALQWLVKEMQVRYEILKQLGLRNIGAFNVRKINKDLEASLNIPIPEQMPMIVAIVDEFADLMMASSADLETPIARIAQMARAVGIHLILATQRPSREVITGIIKANIPTRISFKVASRINSQIILDEVGAESLLGNGDCLFLPPGSSQLIRAQGSYISDEDINQIIDQICKQSPPNYLIPSFDSFQRADIGPDKDDDKPNDPLYDQALTTVLGSKSASTTYLQRKLKIGYARAASLMDALEMNGIIGPQEGARPRRVLANQTADPSEENEELS